MAWTQTDLDALERTIAELRGARQIAFGDQSVAFNSLESLEAQRAVMRRELGLEAGTTRSFRVATVSKGV